METREMIERWRAQMSRPHVVIHEVRKLGSDMAEMLAITESGYQQICAKNDQLQELIKKLTEALNGANDLAEAARGYLDYCNTATKMQPLNMSVVRHKRAALRAALHAFQQDGSNK